MVGHECTADCVVDWSYSMPNMVWNFKPVDFKFSTLYQTFGQKKFTSSQQHIFQNMDTKIQL